MESFNREDLPMVVEGDGVEFRKQEVGDMTIAWVRLPQGADMRPALKGLPGDLCQCPHWGYMQKGLVRMHTADGHEDFEAGQAFYWGPGHGPEALEDSEYIDISPTQELNQVLEHIQSGGGD